MGTFLVTSHGRSGTKFLARELNRSKVWTVEHESRESAVDRRFFGNVDSLMRTAEIGPEWEMLAVIVRPPLAIARSAFFKHPSRWDTFLELLQKDLLALDRLLLLPGTLRIQFERMVTDIDYLLSIAVRLGIDDLNKTDFDMSPVNSSPPGPLMQKQIDAVNEASAWFDRKWC